MKDLFFSISPEGAENFMKALLQELKPQGICTDGCFSILTTDLPFVMYDDLDMPKSFNEDGGTEDLHAGFWYRHFDYTASISYLEYESCTGSKIQLYITANGAVKGFFENIGFQTYLRFVEACKTVFRTDEHPSIFIPGDVVRDEDKEKTIQLLKKLAEERTFDISTCAHLNGWHWNWVQSPI